MSGVFAWERFGLTGHLGDLRLHWDHSGRLTVAGRHCDLALRLATAGTLQAPDGQRRAWDQGFDPRPQFLFAEEGPARLALRVRYRIYDEAGAYHGDGLHEVFAYPDGEVWAAFAVSFADQAAHRCIRDAWLAAEVSGADPGAWLAGGGQLPPRAQRRLESAHPVVLPAPAACLAVGWHPDSGAIADPSGPADPWVRSDRAPYYERWGDLFDQWPGEPGWSRQLGAGLERRGRTLLWVWRRRREETAAPLEGHRSILRLRFGDSADRLQAWASALRQPLVPAAQGAAYRYFHTLDGTYVFRKQPGKQVQVHFPADPCQRQVHVCLFDLEGMGAVQASVDGRATVAHTVSLGGRLDDPLGSSPGRVDDHGGPVITDPDRPPFEVFVNAALSASAPTQITVREGPGLALSYQRFDDRRQLTLTSSAAGGSAGQLALRDGKLRGLRRPGAQDWGICQIPLYWFKANALTPFHYINQPRGFELLENGPRVARFRYRSANTGERVRSQAEVAVRLEGGAVWVDLDTRLEVVKRWDLPEIQYLNIFPADTVYPDGWQHDQFVLMDSTGRWMHHRPGLPPAQAVIGGQELWDPVGPVFFAEFASPRGNLFILARGLEPADLAQKYQICVHWLDSHFHVDHLPTPLPAGTVITQRLQIALAGDEHLDADQARRIGQRSLEAGRLVFSPPAG